MPISTATLRVADPVLLTRALAGQDAPSGRHQAPDGRVSWAGAHAYWSARPSAGGVQLTAGASSAGELSTIQQRLDVAIAHLAPQAAAPAWSPAIDGSDVQIVPPVVDDYLRAQGPEPDEVLGDLYAATLAAAGPASMMQVSHDEGALLTLLARLTGAACAVEVGTFTGYSTICIARGLRPGGRLITCDVSAQWAAIGARHWAQAGLSGVIEARTGPAIDTLRQLPAGPTLDFAFIDADKEGYRSYYEQLVPRMRPGGLIVLDNVFLGGRVLDPAFQEPHHRAMRELNNFVRSDPRVEAVMIPVRDGMTIARRLQ
jgi:caffeoyl-CoA O-methyltransferase